MEEEDSDILLRQTINNLLLLIFHPLLLNNTTQRSQNKGQQSCLLATTTLKKALGMRTASPATAQCHVSWHLMSNRLTAAVLLPVELALITVPGGTILASRTIMLTKCHALRMVLGVHA